MNAPNQRLQDRKTCSFMAFITLTTIFVEIKIFPRAHFSMTRTHTYFKTYFQRLLEKTRQKSRNPICGNDSSFSKHSNVSQSNEILWKRQR
jgi:hypothetical protein